VNVNEYISSGIIESNVLGLVSDAERQEFEDYCAQYPELAEARDSFERALESTLQNEAVTPPAHLKSKIQTLLIKPETEFEKSHELKHTEAPVHKMGMWKWLAAASVILLAFALFWGISNNNKYNKIQESNRELKEKLDQHAAELAELKKDASTLQKQGMKLASLQGTQNAPGSFANIYWDTTTKDVYLLINNMPRPPTQQQYQLWALISGKPVDLGVIEYSLWQKNLLVKMKNVHNAEAFAITLEPKGGSVNPTMDKMYVMGKL